MPVELVGDLRALIVGVHSPLAVRSSSLLEDALERPFAGVYATKMIPNNQFDPDIRFRRLLEAIKFVWASTYFREARDYIRATDRDPSTEKMAVIVQEMVNAEWSGVVFTNDPVTGAADRFVLECVRGLGEALVQGKAVPERIIVEKASRRVSDSPSGERSLPESLLHKLCALRRGRARPSRCGSPPA